MAGVTSILWVIYGYSFATTDSNAFIGGASKLFLKGVTPDSDIKGVYQRGRVSHFNIQILFDRPFSSSQPQQIPKRGFDRGHLGGAQLAHAA